MNKLVALVGDEKRKATVRKLGFWYLIIGTGIIMSLRPYVWPPNLTVTSVGSILIAGCHRSSAYVFFTVFVVRKNYGI